MDRNEVINKVFPHSFMGYDPVAVDAFLDEVIREFDRLTNTIDVLQFRIAHELEGIPGEFVASPELTEGVEEAPGLVSGPQDTDEDIRVRGEAEDATAEAAEEIFEEIAEEPVEVVIEETVVLPAEETDTAPSGDED